MNEECPVHYCKKVTKFLLLYKKKKCAWSHVTTDGDTQGLYVKDNYLFDEKLNWPQALGEALVRLESLLASDAKS